MSEYVRMPLIDEEYREYDFSDSDGEPRVYRIDAPLLLVYREGGTTHDIVDRTGVVHCVPALGYFNCVLRRKAWPGKDSVSF